MKPDTRESAALRFLYHTAPGRGVLKLLTRPGLSRAAGRFLDAPTSRLLIGPFARKNNIRRSDYLPERYCCFNDFFCRRIRPELRPLPEDPAALARARAIADGLELPHARGALSSATQAAIDGHVFRMDDGNRLGLKWLRFTFGKDECLWEFENATGAHQLSLGIGKNIRQEFPERYCALRIDQKAERGYDCFASAAWAAPDTLLISVHIADKYLGQLRMTARFGEDTVTLLGEKHAEWFLDEFTGFASGRACQ